MLDTYPLAVGGAWTSWVARGVLETVDDHGLSVMEC